MTEWRDAAASAANFEGGQVFTDQNGYTVTMTPAHLSEAHPFAYKMRHFFEVARDVIYESAEERREEQIP